VGSNSIVHKSNVPNFIYKSTFIISLESLAWQFSGEKMSKTREVGFLSKQLAE